ncbi:DUF572-domain-containing protein [Gonapodya prolifera JEL478]|uniref:DUF572-domain-containing protein n=1 Tax=Gonapodya prolifera (strain JEL478) TaxID=1344416 RepID=A0A139ALV7_GONPJ|nr:DUF572-domain-containing protein [Gonapodya prolifera JEL478]|eukprot:KXS17483.1 DUF572-domain-containing protein [Gonapodya prolifera JEL478]
MADRKNVNKYYPPDWDPSKGSINTYMGSHPLRERAKRLKTEGILVIRFEMPFNIWCGGCGNHIGMGVRYNAQKKKVGNYYSTPILQFRMKCHLCDNWIEITTDPKNAEYVVTAGARRKNEEYTAEDAEVLNLVSAEEREKLATDPMYRLEHQKKDSSKVEDLKPVLERLQDISDITWSDPYALNYRLRAAHRAERKKDADARKDAAAVATRLGLAIPVLPADQSDADLAKRAVLAEGLASVDTGGSGSVSGSKGKPLPRAPLSLDELEREKRRVVEGGIFATSTVKQASLPVPAKTKSLPAGTRPANPTLPQSSTHSSSTSTCPTPTTTPTTTTSASTPAPALASTPARARTRTTVGLTRSSAKREAARQVVADLAARAKVAAGGGFGSGGLWSGGGGDVGVGGGCGGGGGVAGVTRGDAPVVRKKAAGSGNGSASGMDKMDVDRPRPSALALSSAGTAHDGSGGSGGGGGGGGLLGIEYESGSENGGV